MLFKVAEKLQKTNPIKYFGIASKMLNYIRTNIDIYECLDLAYTVFKFPSLVTEQLSIPVPELSSDEKIEGIGWVIKMDRYQNAVILNDFIFEDYLPDFILNRSTEKDESIYFEYDGFGTSYDESYYYEEEYYEPVIDEPVEEEVVQPELPANPEEPSDDSVPPVDENNPGDINGSENSSTSNNGNNEGGESNSNLGENQNNNTIPPEGNTP